MWAKFQNESQDAVLQVKGLRKSTYITPIYNVIPLNDIANEFYSEIEKKPLEVNLTAFSNQLFSRML